MDRGFGAGLVLVFVMLWFSLGLPLIIYVNVTGHLPW